MNTEWKLVPVEPVDEQQLAGAQAIRMDTTPLNKMFTANRVYRDMIAAAPPAPTSHPIPTGATGEEKDESGMSPYCPECDGGGRISVLSDNSPDAHDVDIDCTHCGGTGSAVDAAKNLARALQSERMQHLQIYGEYKNFHRSLCARFGYGHDPVHFRRDLVSLEEAIAAKVSTPAAGDALDAKRYRWLRDPQNDPALVLDKRTGYVPEDEGIPGVGGYHIYEYRAGEVLDAAIDAAIAQQKGEA